MIITGTSLKLIYFYGFGSSAASGTIRPLRERLTDFDVIAQVNCEEAFLQHYHNVIYFSGGHRLDNTTVNEVLIPLIHLLA